MSLKEVAGPILVFRVKKVILDEKIAYIESVTHTRPVKSSGGGQVSPTFNKRKNILGQKL